MKGYYCDEGLEELQGWFSEDFRSFCGKEILEECEELSVDALFAQAALSGDEENGRRDNTRYVLSISDTKIEQVKGRASRRKLAWAPPLMLYVPL